MAGWARHAVKVHGNFKVNVLDLPFASFDFICSGISLNMCMDQC